MAFVGDGPTPRLLELITLQLRSDAGNGLECGDVPRVGGNPGTRCRQCAMSTKRE